MQLEVNRTITVMFCKMFGINVKYIWFEFNGSKTCKCISTHVLFPTALSTEAARMSIWRKTSFWAIHRVLARRPSLTCERWARGFVCPLESTSSSPPPLNPAKRLTLSSESSLRSNQRQSMYLLHVILMLVYVFLIWNLNLMLKCLHPLQRTGWWSLCRVRRWCTYQWDVTYAVGKKKMLHNVLYE